jgi:predicted transcriptional regulator
MLNMTASLLGPLQQSVMECFWASGPQTSRDILTTLRMGRTIAHTTVTTTLSRLFDQGLLTRELAAGRKMPWQTFSLGDALLAKQNHGCPQPFFSV